MKIFDRMEYIGDFDKLKDYGFKRELYQGSYFMIKRVFIDYETKFQNTTDFDIFIGLNKREVDFGWCEKRKVKFNKGLIGFRKADLNLYDGYSYGSLFNDKEAMLERINDIIDELDNKDSESAGRLYELDCMFKQLIKDGLVIKEEVE